MLALAGARDVASIDRWLAAHRRGGQLRLAVRALRSFAAADHAQAGMLFGAVVPRIGELGGSGAQNELFAALRDEAWRRHGAQLERDDGPPPSLRAA